MPLKKIQGSVMLEDDIQGFHSSGRVQMISRDQPFPRSYKWTRD